MDNYIFIIFFINDLFWEIIELIIFDNWVWGKSYNVLLEDMVKVIEKVFENGYIVVWGVDVLEKGFNFCQGIVLVLEDLFMIQMKGVDNCNFNNVGVEKVFNVFFESVKELVVIQEMCQKGYDEKMIMDDYGMYIVGLYKD